MNLLEVCAELVSDHHWLPEQIEKLDRWWIAFVIFHPRDEKGKLKVSHKPKDPRAEDNSPRGVHFRWAASWGLPDWLAEKMWAEKQQSSQEKRRG